MYNKAQIMKINIIKAIKKSLFEMLIFYYKISIIMPVQLDTRFTLTSQILKCKQLHMKDHVQLMKILHRDTRQEH